MNSFRLVNMAKVPLPTSSLSAAVHLFSFSAVMLRLSRCVSSDIVQSRFIYIFCDVFCDVIMRVWVCVSSGNVQDS